MTELDGLFIGFSSGKENQKTLVILDHLSKVQNLVELTHPWNDYPWDIIPRYTPIRITDVISDNQQAISIISLTKESLLFIDRDVLINARSIQSAADCPRKVHVQTAEGESKQNEPAIRGTIIHECWSRGITSSQNCADQVDDVINHFELDLQLLGANKEELTSEILPVLEELDKVDLSDFSDFKMETTLLAPEAGTRGRIDGWSQEAILELKTGKKPNLGPWPGDQVQAAAYLLGIQGTARETKSAYVIYTGKKGEPAILEVPYNTILKKKTVHGRNWAYIVRYLGYIPPPLPVGSRTCQYCFDKNGCMFLCAALNQFRECSTCYQNRLCGKGALPDEAVNYYVKFADLIRLERIESQRQLARLWRDSPEKREKAGWAIRDLVVEKIITENGKVDYHFLCYNESELKTGDFIILSSWGEPDKNHACTGRILKVTKHKIIVETGSYIDGPYQIDRYSVEITFNRMNRSLFQTLITGPTRQKDLLIFDHQPRFSTENFALHVHDLDEMQTVAVERALQGEDLLLIQGPAGTGKTYTISRIIYELAKRGKRVLVLAYTNTAVDNILNYVVRMKKKYADTPDFIRIGVSEVVSDNLHEFLISNAVGKESANLLQTTPVIAATVTSFSKAIFDSFMFDVAILDEASQMTEPSALVAFLHSKKVILVGDDKQLPPIVQSEEAKEQLSISLFERLAEKARKNQPNGKELIILDFQYRMNDKLLGFSNSQFYNNIVQSANEQIANQTLADIQSYSIKSSEKRLNEIADPLNPLIYLETNGIFNSRKRLNEREKDVIIDLVKLFHDGGIELEDIGIIAPYRGQVSLIRKGLSELYDEEKLDIDTVDRFQGQDREIVIFSLTGNPGTSYSLLSDARRVNVALTRAKKKLIVIGGNISRYSEELITSLIRHISENGKYIRVDQEEESQEENLQNVIQGILMEGKTVIKIDEHRTYAKDPKETISIVENEKEGKFNCILCLKKIEKDKAKCPSCKNNFHLEHLKEVKKCPICHTRIKILNQN